jgi:predicted ATPase/signal transduction histidine kinase
MHPDYELLTPLRADERFEMHRARRRRTGAPVLLKRVLRRPAPAADLAALQREAALAATLEGAATLLPRWIDNPPLLVMEDPGGMLLSDLVAAARLPLETVLQIALQLTGALAELHRRGLTHHGLRPEAVLCDLQGPRLWLIDVCEAGAAIPRPGVAAAPDRLVYMAPEQTGRMDSGADARSDLYAVGIMLYELLTGAPPFRSADALALIHWQIAGVPVPPAQLDPAIPAPLSALVMKLIAKMPDERYQSARGLARDLSRCAHEWSTRTEIAPFALGQDDRGERLVVSRRLYGREREVDALLEAFEAACRGESAGRMLLVEGYSGIGKTALIQQLVRPIVRRRGYFVSGKFDQVARGVPHGALIQAFRSLVQQLLTENEAQLARWRATIAAALGGNGGVLAEVIPEIELVIGPQAAPVKLGSVEAQNRFQRVVQQFVATFARPEHPLVLFLDDLQWADAATLALLEPLLSSADIGSLMLMGAYRDNEIDASPRLVRTFAALAQAGVTLRRVSLGPLRLPDLVELVAETLGTGAAQVEPLARLVFEKTGGNPFFVIQFLKQLERDGHIRFAADAGHWSYRLEAIAGAPLADNVIDLMTRSIQRLPPKTQYALTLAACIGNRFDSSTLAIVSEQSSAATGEDIDRALAEGLVVPVAAPLDASPGADGRYAFLHDRVQQAAYALIPAERRRMVHLAVGRLLRARADTVPLDAGLFEIVQHLNIGRHLIVAEAERREVAALDLAAGRKAKSATAHDTALELLQAGIGLLDEHDWSIDPTLCFELQVECAESLYLCGRFDAALAALEGLFARARTPIERARIVALRSVQFENMARYGDALASMREGLALFGVTFPDAEDEKVTALEREIATIDLRRGGREIAALIELPGLTDPTTRMVMGLLTDIWSAAYIVGDPTLARLVSATLVRLSLEHGNVEESAYGYVTHAITVGPVRGDYRDAYEYGKLALAVNRRFDDARRRAKIYQQFHAHVALWCEPWRHCISYAKEACRSGLDSGDFLYAAYGAGTEVWVAWAAAQDLGAFVDEHAPSVALIEKLKNTAFADAVRIILNGARALQGQTTAPVVLSGTDLTEEAFVERYREQPFFACIHAVVRLEVLTLLGSPAEALAAAQRADELIRHMPGTVWSVLFDFWSALALAAGVTDASADKHGEVLGRLRQARDRFDRLARSCAQNFRCQALLIGAEIARLDGRERDAIDACEAVLEFASDTPQRPFDAIAHELLGRLRMRRGQLQLARREWRLARDAYARWGAAAKAEAMTREHALGEAAPALPARPAADPVATDGSLPISDGLDLFSVLKATQAIAGEVELGTLLTRLLHIAVENAGAERGALVLEDDTGAIVHASDGSAEVALSASDAVPVGLVHYVRRTAVSVVLAQADTDERHGGDPYVVRHRPRSVACLPVQRQGRLVGVLYLENRNVAGAFTPRRLDTLRILATQAAISVENARLFAALEAENSQLRRDLVANVSHDLRTPLVAMRGYLELLAAKGDALAPEQRAQYLDIAVRQSEHLATLIDELFELARLDFRGTRLEREPMAFAELAADVVQKFQLTATQRGIVLSVNAPGSMPFIDADVSLMERVLDNLVGNALQHTPAGGHISVTVDVRDERLHVEVVDTGRGIPGAELPFIFDRHYRGADGRGAGTAGAGLGLAIAKRILELHGSTIQAASDCGAGTRFSFELPLAAAGRRPA